MNPCHKKSLTSPWNATESVWSLLESREGISNGEYHWKQDVEKEDLIFKPGSAFPPLQRHQERDSALTLHCHTHLCISHRAFFVVQARRGTDPSFRATGCPLPASQGGWFVYTASNGGNGLATLFAPYRCYKCLWPHLKGRHCVFATIFSVLNRVARARQNTGVSGIIRM